MSYGKVSDAFWHDDKIRALSERARYIMLYLMSCPHGNRIGLFVLDPGYAASDLSSGGAVWEPLHVTEALGELRDRGRIGWHQETRTVFVRHYLRHNTLLNGSVVKGALNDLRSVPDTPLLKDLHGAVLEGQIGPGGPIRDFYGDLQEELERRIGPGMVSGVDAGRTHNAEHDADQAQRARARSLPLPSRTVPTLSSPHLSDPPLPGRPVEDGGEDDEDLESQIKAATATARANIVRIHGDTEKPVEIEGHKVGVGIEIKAFQALCREGRDPPEIIAAAIAFLPAVSTLEAPVSLRRWAAADGMGLYAECVGRAYKASPIEYTAKEHVGRAIHGRQTAEETAAIRAGLRAQVEQLKSEASG